MEASKPKSKLTGAERIQRIASKIRSIPDFPKPGINFRDITTLWNDAEGFCLSIDAFAEKYGPVDFDSVVGIESRGFIIGAALADRLGKGFIPIRKQGKLPAEVERYEYQLEYGTDALRLQQSKRPIADAEVDRVEARGGIGVKDCLTKGTDAGVGRVGNGERRRHRALFEHFHAWVVGWTTPGIRP